MSALEYVREVSHPYLNSDREIGRARDAVIVKEFLRRTQRAEARLLHQSQYVYFVLLLLSAYTEVLDSIDDAESGFHL